MLRCPPMVRLVFSSPAARRDAVAFLLGRYSFQCRGGHDLFVSERAADVLVGAEFPFEHGGPADDVGFALSDTAGRTHAMRRFEIFLPLPPADGPAEPDRDIAGILTELEVRVANIAVATPADHVWPQRLDHESDATFLLLVYAMDTDEGRIAVRDACERLK